MKKSTKKQWERVKNFNHQTFTVDDVITAECTLEPIVCIFCGSTEVTFNQQICDAHCANCGEWQKGEDYTIK